MRSILHWCASFAIAVIFAAPFTFPSAQAHGGAGPVTVTQGIPEIPVADLPREARETLRLIRQNGPFPHERDGVVFGNFEKLLPWHERGYYREYTVKTPSVKGRGARRIVAGCAFAAAGQPCATSGDLYYTDDHYRSFRRIRE